MKRFYQLVLVLFTMRFWLHLTGAATAFSVLTWCLRLMGFYSTIEPQFIILFAYLCALHDIHPYR